jgi:hypothetical protein
VAPLVYLVTVVSPQPRNKKNKTMGSKMTAASVAPNMYRRCHR